MKIYMGYDEREAEAYRVAVRSLAKFTKTEVTPIDSARLASSGLFRRPLDRRGSMYDPLVVDVFMDMQRDWVSTPGSETAERASPYHVPLTVPLQPT